MVRYLGLMLLCCLAHVAHAQSVPVSRVEWFDDGADVSNVYVLYACRYDAVADTVYIFDCTDQEFVPRGDTTGEPLAWSTVTVDFAASAFPYEPDPFATPASFSGVRHEYYTAPDGAVTVKLHRLAPAEPILVDGFETILGYFVGLGMLGAAWLVLSA